MPIRAEPAVTDWDITIERAQSGNHVEEKLLRTRHLLSAATQRSRLRGDKDILQQLSERLSYVHDLLDHL
jgi:hypothetical protein